MGSEDEARRAFYEAAGRDFHKMRPWLYGFLAFLSVVVALSNANPIFGFLTMAGVWILGYLLRHYGLSIANRCIMMVGYFKTLHAFHRDLDHGATSRQLAITPDSQLGETGAISDQDRAAFEEIMRRNNIKG
jgi:hypothetical protein